MRAIPWLLCSLIIACGARHGTVTSSSPTLWCNSCSSEATSSTIATYSTLRVRTAWFGVCYRSEGGSILPTPGDGDEEETQFPCGVVDHTPAVRCQGAACTITPVPAAQATDWFFDNHRGVNQHYYHVVPTTPGNLLVEGELARRGATPGRPSAQVRVVTPDRLHETHCGTTGFVVALGHTSGPLAMGPATLTATVDGASCSQRSMFLNEHGPTYDFECTLVPERPATLVVRGRDFELTTTCRPVAPPVGN